MSRSWFYSIAAVLVLSGCHDDVAPRDVTPPASPRGVTNVTGDHEVFISWLENTEADVAGYNIYEGSCDRGPSCPYKLIGTTTHTTFTVTGLANGVTRFWGVTAFDESGNESELSNDVTFDTPRPEGFGRALNNFVNSTSGSGWDFSAATARAYNDGSTDMYFGDNGSIAQMFVPDVDTNIQDAGFHSTLDGVDFAPTSGWSPTGTVELIVGHCYIVWTRDDHYAKFRVTSLSASQVVFDWAYQVDTGNRELKARPASEEGGTPAPFTRRPIYWAR
jgi:hypothetical protein